MCHLRKKTKVPCFSRLRSTKDNANSENSYCLFSVNIFIQTAVLHFVCCSTDWAVSEPTGTTEDWAAEDWGNEKPTDTANTPSWATTDDEKTASTWQTDAPANQNLTNHVNHLPEW